MKLNLKDWPLIVFTVLVQTAVGSFIFLFGLLVINRRHLGQFGSAWLFPWLFRPALDLLLLMGLSLLISLFHLGRPSSAYLAVVNLKTSWLSREILAACLFFAGLLVLTVSIFFGLPLTILLLISCLDMLVGLALIFIMSKIYRLPAVPAWNSCRTTLSFYLTALLTGAGFLALVGPPLFEAWPEGRLQLTVILQITLLISLIYIILLDQVTGLFSLKNEIEPEKFSELKKISTIRVLLLILALLASFYVFWPAGSVWLQGYFWPVLILALIIIEELIGRTVFFNLYSRLGV
ncbi:MAG TPA: dimethyl sulfoxide reductase anchor subunit [Candidatus Saccharicenans sp.]|nr:dimethyl sulfoxide reductase anchor subunit [Candidatus Saccharicenans sp.]HOT68346.1 dimethyl sulfoxide reductase anchor subunit [Candidatus Saccharicenans sp.]HPC87724.1 dimethyl sulfoxide reductase anchor subunit [Candidatus Saccharicenans sp.]HQE63943.1 dimethyl sulfoxide reductase anchor subunit [Candidatus Saccharicenans sp.]HQH60426.1 dimethyl sulfoxide reductase anchor subunit [Candidatus Saccharicenans sp.]